MSEALSLRDLIFSEPDRPVSPDPVPTPEWPKVDGKVHVRALSGDQRDRFETFMAAALERKGKRSQVRANTAGIRALMVAEGCCTKDGEQIFTVADVQAVGKKSAVVLDRLYDAIRKISGMDREAEEETGKNSETTTGEDLSLA